MPKIIAHYYVEGVGYSTIVDILTAAITDTRLCVALFAAKLLATLLTLGAAAGRRGFCIL